MNLDLYRDDLFPSEALVSGPTLISKAAIRRFRLGRVRVHDAIVREEDLDLNFIPASFIVNSESSFPGGNAETLTIFARDRRLG